MIMIHTLAVLKLTMVFGPDPFTVLFLILGWNFLSVLYILSKIKFKGFLHKFFTYSISIAISLSASLSWIIGIGPLYMFSWIIMLLTFIIYAIVLIRNL